MEYDFFAGIATGRLRHANMMCSLHGATYVPIVLLVRLQLQQRDRSSDAAEDLAGVGRQLDLQARPGDERVYDGLPRHRAPGEEEQLVAPLGI